MARTIEEIKKDITTSFMTDEDVKRIYGLRSEVFENEFSKVSLESLLFYIVAVSIWSVEKLMDVFEGEQIEALEKLHPHTLRWYTDKAKAYQHGYNLPPFEDVYDNSLKVAPYNNLGITQEDINKSKIVSYASAVSGQETNGSAFVKIKVAKRTGDNMSRLNKSDDEGVDDELTPFTAYMEQIKDAGVILKCESWDADYMRMSAEVLVDPKQFYSDGRRIGTGVKDIEKAFKDYLSQLPFDGIYSKTAHIDHIQKVQGVRTVELFGVGMFYGNEVKSDAVVDGFRPFSGWARFKDEIDPNNPINLIITYRTEYKIDDNVPQPF
jgi:hypothetical protein